MSLKRQFIVWRVAIFSLGLAAHLLGAVHTAQAINIIIDYRYDNGPTPFFNTQQKRNALQAAADRMSNIITSSLSAVTISGDATKDPRISFLHPSTGLNYEVSSADSVANDAFAPPSCSPSPNSCYAANEYRGTWSINANEWILYAGGRPLSSSAVGGTGTGLNVGDTYTSAGSHLNRNFPRVSALGSLPLWGGSISFDNDGSTNWHFDLNTPASGSSVDFYSIALHEIGHALGLSSDWSEWQDDNAGHYIGPKAVNAYNADNGTSRVSLDEVNASNEHWKDGAYDSYIFMNGSPNLVGTVGVGVKQDLIMEPTANFTATVKRFEMTNVDVAALEDIKWSVLPKITVLPGDYNSDGTVDAADYVMWRKGGTSGTYATWRQNFGRSLSGAGGGASVSTPEPVSAAIVLVFAATFACWRRRQRG